MKDDRTLSVTTPKYNRNRPGKKGGRKEDDPASLLSFRGYLPKTSSGYDI